MTIASIEDPAVRRYIASLNTRIEELERRTNRALSEEGTILAHLPQGTKKATPTGDKELTAGAVTVLDDLDDVPDGTTHGKVLGADLTAAQVHQVRDTVLARNVTGDQIYDKGADDLDDVSDGSVHARVLAAELSSGQVARVRDVAGARNVTGDQIFDKGADDADDVTESATKKWAAETGADVTGNNAAATITGQGDLATLDTVGAGQIDDDSINGDMFSSAVQAALIQYNADSGPGSESAWDAV